MVWIHCLILVDLLSKFQKSASVSAAIPLWGFPWFFFSIFPRSAIFVFNFFCNKGQQGKQTKVKAINFITWHPSGVDVFTFGTFETLAETFDVRFRDHVDNDPCVSLFGTSVASLLKKERPHKKFQECLFCAACGLCSLWPSSPCHCCWVTSTTDNATKKLGQEKSWIDREWELEWDGDSS